VFSGDGGLATAAGLGRPGAVAVDKAGNVAIADPQDPRLQIVAGKTGTFFGKHMLRGHIYTIAGTGTPGFLGDGGRATKAELNQPGDVAADTTGNLLIADTGNNRVRVVAARNGTFYGVAMKAAHLYTIAGNGNRSDSGDGRSALQAEMFAPEATAVSSNGNVLIAESRGNRVRLAAATSGTFYGQKMVAGRIYTVAGNGRPGIGSDGGLATSTQVWGPDGVAQDHSGNIIVADTGSTRVRVVAAKAGTFYGQAMVTGHIYTIAGDGTDGYTGDGGPATSAEVSIPVGVAVDAAGNVLVTQEENGAVRLIATTPGTFYGQAMVAGDIYTIAGDGDPGYSGDGGPATAAQLNAPVAVAADPAGNVVISDNGNDRVRVTAASTGTFYGQAMVAGDIYTVAGNGKHGFGGDGGPAGSAKISGPWGVTIDQAGNLLLADTGNARVRLVAAATGTFYGAPRTTGDIFTIAGTGAFGFSGDGGPATSASVGALGLATGPGGEVVISDGTSNRIRVISG
jgi:hypothetical protein